MTMWSAEQPTPSCLSEHDCFCLAAQNPPNLCDATPFIRPTALEGTNEPKDIRLSGPPDRR